MFNGEMGDLHSILPGPVLVLDLLDFELDVSQG